jgi:transcriptional regulator with XRE-family HTH domain
MTPIRLTGDRQLGAMLRGLRLAAGLTQQQLGDRIHITKKGISNREVNSRAVTAGALIETAQALGYTVALIPPRPGARPTGTGWPA